MIALDWSPAHWQDHADRYRDPPACLFASEAELRASIRRQVAAYRVQHEWYGLSEGDKSVIRQLREYHTACVRRERLAARYADLWPVREAHRG